MTDEHIRSDRKVGRCRVEPSLVLASLLHEDPLQRRGFLGGKLQKRGVGRLLIREAN